MKSRFLPVTPLMGIALALVAPVSAQDDSSTSLVPLLDLVPVVPTDTVAPEITNVLGLSVLPTEATVSWTTNELADSRLEYGTTLSYGTQATLDVSLSLVHSAVLLGLAPSTTYYYCVHSKDVAGNNASDCGRSFTTVADPFPVVTVPPDTVAPVITDVFGVSVLPSSATVSWTTNELADSRLEYGTTLSYGTQATLDLSMSLVHSAVLLGLAPSTTYYYCVHSTDVAGNNASECGRTLVTAAMPIVFEAQPPTISAVTLSGITPTSASITWSTDALADSQVEFGFTNVYGQYTVLNTALDLIHQAELSNLLPDTQYHFRIKSSDDAGRQAVSADYSFVTAALSPVATPPTESPVEIDITGPVISGLAASSITDFDATVLLTTNELAVVQVEFGETMEYGNVTDFGTSLDWIHVQWLLGLSPNTRYHYRIRAIDASGNVTISGDHEFTSLELPADLGSVPVISNISVTSVETNSATITWKTDVPTNSQLEYGPSSNYGASTEISPVLSTTHQETITGLIPNSTYHFRVKSKEAVGNIAFSADRTFTTAAVLAAPPPQAVGDLSVSIVLQTSAILSWTGPTGDSAVNYYFIRYATFPLTNANFNDGENIYESVLYMDPNEPSGIPLEYTIVGLTPGTRYYFAIQSVDSDVVVSPISNVAVAITLSAPIVSGAPSNGAAVEPAFIDRNGTLYRVNDNTPPGQPMDVRAQALDSRIGLSWTNPSDVDFLRLTIVRKKGSYPSSATDGEIIYDGDAEASIDDKAAFTDTGLLNGHTYYYGLYAYDSVPNFSAPVRLSAAPKAVMLHKEYVVIPAYMHPVPSFTPSKNISFGESSHEIEHVQELLATDTALYPAGLVDGYFGPLMKRAIVKLQARHGLAQSGVIDTATRLKVIELSKLHQIVEAPLEATTMILARDLYRGTRGEDVKYLQTYLRDHGFYPEGLTNGKFDHQLEHAVMRFKQQFGIEPVSGYVGIHVRREIHELAVR